MDWAQTQSTTLADYGATFIAQLAFMCARMSAQVERGEPAAIAPLVTDVPVMPSSARVSMSPSVSACTKPSPSRSRQESRQEQGYERHSEAVNRGGAANRADGRGRTGA